MLHARMEGKSRLALVGDVAIIVFGVFATVVTTAITIEGLSSGGGKEGGGRCG
jgi:hypothetical protein